LRRSGWKETQVVVRFWIITMLLCLVGLVHLEAEGNADAAITNTF
jgi:UDP-N-acetylmuramyl pentapeptide phosphotransferase/UDP-N-acetylglucosamine-1-phosphate transferase